MELNKKKGTTIVMVLHDLNLSARYADHIFAMKSGRLIAEGTPEDVITCSLVEDVYNLTCSIMKDPVSGSPMMIPMGKYHCEESCQSCRCASNWS
jgi:iron complex transport system ATP-binding protein